MEKYVVLEKKVGETPLACAEKWRAAQPPAYANVPLAYAGRLDPMASGKLLILIGDECKQQDQYHGLDKEYEFSVLFGIESDTHDVLGRLTTCEASASYSTIDRTIKINKYETEPKNTPVNWSMVEQAAVGLVGNIALPYPHFSSKTVRGKPLHTWTLEGRLDEIEIPTNESTVYKLELTDLETKSRKTITTEARAKIDTIPPVTDPRKSIGNDFRRADVRQDWAEVASGNFGPNHSPLPDSYTIAHFRCITSTGTYMRSLAHFIGQKLGIRGLAWHIHRTTIGTYNSKEHIWTKTFEQDSS